jgi:hypothetical protein
LGKGEGEGGEGLRRKSKGVEGGGKREVEEFESRMVARIEAEVRGSEKKGGRRKR